GVVIPPTLLDDEAVARLVAQMRNPDERRGDLRAQLAAHRLAEQRVAQLCAQRGKDTVTSAMNELYAYSERAMRAGLARLPDGRYEASDLLEPMEGKLELHAAVTITGDAVTIDFDGTSPQHEGNLNCPLAVARSACFYVVRVLIDPDVPASGGAFAPVTVAAPEGCLVNARPPAAVAAATSSTASRPARSSRATSRPATWSRSRRRAAGDGEARLSLMTGRVEGIYISAERGELPEPVESVRALAGRGLEGNRYFFEREAPSGVALTLIAAEAVEA